MSSQERFGYAWKKYAILPPIYEEQFSGWMGDLRKEDFKNKKILDAGCGMGRYCYLTATAWGAKKVVGFDFDFQSIDAATDLLKHTKNAEVQFQDIYKINYENEFDIVFSIGVLHHLENPGKALRNLYSATKSGGKLAIWVYGYKNNEWVVKYINPIRKITSKLPLLLTHAISYVFATPLYLFLKIFPHKNQYMKTMAKTSYKHIIHTVLDHLVPRVANYWTKEEVMALVKKLPGPLDYKIQSVRDYSWSVVINKV